MNRVNIQFMFKFKIRFEEVLYKYINDALKIIVIVRVASLFFIRYLTIFQAYLNRKKRKFHVLNIK